MPVPVCVPIDAQEPAGYDRKHALCAIGVPLPRGAVRDPARLILTDDAGHPQLTQTRVLASWPDGSAKWLLVESQVAMAAHERRRFLLRETSVTPVETAQGCVTVSTLSEMRYRIDTGAAQFDIGGRGALIDAVTLDGISMLDAAGVYMSLTGCTGRVYGPVVQEARLEAAGPVRATLVLCGHLARGDGPREKASTLAFEARLSFVAGSAAVTIELTLHNPRAARHPGGLWDLDDQGTLLFEDVSLSLKAGAHVEEIRWYAEHASDTHIEAPQEWTLYQDSSGGENWDSDNHVDGQGRSTVTFRGYRVTYGPAAKACLIAEGDRASPALAVITASGTIGATVLEFWQNFPKAIRWSESTLDLGLFPWESCAPFALQGGERKRHTVVIEFTPRGHTPELASAHHPLQVSVEPAWVEAAQALAAFVPAERDGNETYRRYIQTIIAGDAAFEQRREVIDEYGWRNFGDLYADHEAVQAHGPRPLVSHYNNQYDFIYGALIQYLRTADARWWPLAQACARHTVDIDIYHTDADRPAFNRGLFWHTDHYKPAGTCTHRTYSRVNGRGLRYGGGPSNEHNYTSGLLLYYFLTGDPAAAEAVRDLADWVIAMDGTEGGAGSRSGAPSGLASKTADPNYHKAGRGAGNSVNAVLDAYALTHERHYLDKAEALIRRCIHPRDDIDALGLSMPEHRWSYLVFLQVLGKYLHIKLEWSETDDMFHYARESLLHYGRWMVCYEVPYQDILDKVALPTETWPAQDVRKCHVLHLAGEFAAGPERSAFHDRADFFFTRGLEDLLGFETAYLTRPRVILCVYGHVQAYYQTHRVHGVDLACPIPSFGEPQHFVLERRDWRTRAQDLATKLLRTGAERLDILHRLSMPTRL